MTKIRLEHVSYAYDDDKILEDINLQVTSGENFQTQQLSLSAEFQKK